MVQPNPEKRSPKQLNPELYARLKSEAAAPYRSLRKFIYLAFAASGFIGGMIFLTKIIAGKNIETSFPNFALQLGVVALMIGLWRWEQKREQK
jgi:hypothetical protein